MPTVKECTVNFWWDNEASVWIATSKDVYGLVLEHESFDVLLNRVRLAIPELLSFESQFDGDISLDYAVSRKDKLALNG
ncbi:MAG: DUF1902 domain-containing protein [Defluviitaleaceae bacterium]|nr:DUF1902 domain-containing protein [Defluviitaleaceae bacterium]